jgi:hypothetical protein
VQLAADGGETQAARVELSTTAWSQCWMAAGVTAPCVYNRRKRKVTRLRKGQQLLGEEVEVEALSGRRWIGWSGGATLFMAGAKR